MPEYLPDIIINGIKPTDYEQLLGDTLRVNPEIKYGDLAANFTFKWFKSGSTDYYVVSDKPQLSYVLDTLGASIFRLEVTNTETGVMSFRNFQVQVTGRAANRGLYILKENEEGNTDMDALFITDQENRMARDLISIAYAGPMLGKPVGIGFTDSYKYFYTAETSENLLNRTVKIMQLVSEKDLLLYRPLEEEVAKNTANAFFNPAAGRAPAFTGMMATPNQSIVVNNGLLYTLQRTSSAYQDPASGTYQLSPYFTLRQKINWDDSGNNLLGFDNASSSFVFIRYGKTEVLKFPDVYLGEKGQTDHIKISSNNMDGKISFLENTNGHLDTVRSAEHTRAYAIFHPNQSPNEVRLLGLNMAELNQWTHNGTHSPIRSSVAISNSAFQTASLYTLHKKMPVLYFANNNTVSSYHIDDKTWLIDRYTFPADEQITFMKYLNCDYSNDSYKVNHLYIATYKAGNYKLYKFSTANNTLVQDGTPLEGKGKIKTILYMSPDASGMMNGISTYY